MEKLSKELKDYVLERKSKITKEIPNGLVVSYSSKKQLKKFFDLIEKYDLKPALTLTLKNPKIAVEIYYSVKECIYRVKKRIKKDGWRKLSDAPYELTRSFVIEDKNDEYIFRRNK